MEKRGLAKRLQHLGTETSFWVSKEASERKLEGKKTYDLHIGDLNFSTAPQIVQATIEAINNGKTTYAPPRGIPALLETVARVIGEERGIQYTTEEVCIQPGGKPIIGKFLQCCMNEGDEVLYPSPGYPIYESQIDYLGGILKPYVYRETPEGFVLDLDQMRSQITPKTKVLIYNNYHNPTGHASTDEEMAQIAQIAIEHDLWVLSDEAYFHFVFDESKKNRSIAALPGMKERTILLITTSKSWAMTGWRVGAALGPKNVIDMFAKLTTNDEACTCHPLQWAAIQTFGNPEVQQLREIMFQELKARRDLIHELVNQIPGFSALLPPSTFYTFINITKAMEILNCTDYEEFRKRILHATGVSFCTREHFGASLPFETQRYIRFAFSGISQSEIREALSVLKTFMESALIPN